MRERTRSIAEECSLYERFCGLFTRVRGIGILGSSLAGSWIKPRNTPRITPPGIPHSPVSADLVTTVDSYAGLCMPLCVHVHHSSTDTPLRGSGRGCAGFLMPVSN